MQISNTFTTFTIFVTRGDVSQIGHEFGFVQVNLISSFVGTLR